MNIRFLETAVWLAQLRNFRATADRLNITSAAISSRIAAMENELGFRLFERDAREVTLTEQGAKFVDGARELVLSYKDLVHSVDPAPSTRKSVRIGLPSYMVPALIPPIANTLRTKFPEVSFSVLTDTGGGIREKLKADQIDIGFAPLTDEPELFDVEKLCSFGMRWVGSPTLLRHSCDEVLSPEDIACYPIISGQLNTMLDRGIVAYIDGHGQDGLIVHRSDDQTTTIGMAVAAIGITILPEVSILRELKEGALRVLNVSPLLPPSTFAALYTKGTTRDLPRLVASIACEAATAFCAHHDDLIACSAIVTETSTSSTPGNEQAQSSPLPAHAI